MRLWYGCRGCPQCPQAPTNHSSQVNNRLMHVVYKNLKSHIFISSSDRFWRMPFCLILISAQAAHTIHSLLFAMQHLRKSLHNICGAVRTQFQMLRSQQVRPYLCGDMSLSSGLARKSKFYVISFTVLFRHQNHRHIATLWRSNSSHDPIRFRRLCRQSTSPRLPPRMPNVLSVSLA